MAESPVSIDLSIVESTRQAIEEALDEHSHFGEGCPAQLEEAIRYSLLAPGKRLRPILVVMAFEACSLDGQERRDEALAAACAIEMIHAYSLIHDDLPAMDDDELRRGRPTNHVVYGEANAILAGDSLIARAFELLSTKIKRPETAMRCVQTLATAAGACNLVGGQFDDLRCESVPGSREALEHIHRRKTGALLTACVRLGGLIAEATDEQLTSLSTFGNCLGLAFQITDDLLDLHGNEQTMGKKAGMDEQRGKLTYPALIGVTESQSLAKSLIDEACEALTIFDSRGTGLEKIARFVLERSN